MSLNRAETKFLPESSQVSLFTQSMLNPNLAAIELSKEEVQRYSRHIILPEVGLEGQKKLKAASVLCIGTGGLGSPLLLYLAAAGIGRIGIVDFDIVDSSNLQRQIIHGTSWVGKPKIVSAKDRILEINPYCQVDLYETRISSENALDILAPYDVVIDGTDNFPTRYLTNDACVLLDKPNVYGSIFRFEGQATVFNYQGGPNYRDLYPEPPPPGMVPSCAEGGVLGVLPGVIGTIQATEAIKIILGAPDTLSGRLLLYNAWEMKFRELKLRPNPIRPVIEKLIDYEQFCGIPQAKAQEAAEQQKMTEMTVVELKALIDSNANDYILIDVRNPNEYQIANIPNSVLIPLPDIENGSAIPKIKELVNGYRLIAHCKMGGRSAKALAILKDAGIEGINVKGGISAWSREVDSTVPEY
ncbi:putative adenylyltransferase/sulfurtransferase MoeZ (Includes: Sulfur carrier protein CysO adenylyltransferase; Sulfur carrier protein CysO sulfurtransferase) [Microcystis aeruginosa PCC 9808]|uniref:Putative adenylyltransferase/sulfurtransferase MoeZ n=2 Tax=Microcystis aeruginosa TaxID=1126 RepID=I4HFN4_MICAE|nr:putative adenylyltransferase/sulfurtransferase MoeZ (Includes: Sulfur carrier protein CysO adenylyltransferase; Sulfur carrier protein CysO sulfurtransferase) [Microcystis aeruginosa PCC 9808]